MKEKTRSHKVLDRTTSSDSRFELELGDIGDEGDLQGGGEGFADLVYGEGDT